LDGILNNRKGKGSAKKCWGETQNLDTGWGAIVEREGRGEGVEQMGYKTHIG